MNRNWTGKLLLFAYISRKNLCSHTFKASSEKVVVRILRKWRQNPWFSGTWTPSNGYFFFLYKMLEKRLWNTFLLYVVVEIRQLVYEISSFPEVPYKRDNLKKFLKFIDKNLCLSLFLNEIAGCGNLQLSEAATGDVL